MEVRFNAVKEERKALVKAIGEVVGITPIYKGAPGFAFEVGSYTIDRHGSVICGDEVHAEDIRHLLMELSAKGFVPEGGIDEVMAEYASLYMEVTVAGESAEATDSEENEEEYNLTEESTTLDYARTEPLLVGNENGEVHATESMTSAEESTVSETTSEPTLNKVRSAVDEDGLALTIEVPLEGFTSTALDNLDKLITGKAALIIKALGLDSSDTVDTANALPIERTANTLRFSWFPVISSHLEVDAYARLVYAMCEMAKKQKRVTMRERAVGGDDSEKFAFRTFLLRLGFIGQEYASARKVLLSKLSGSGSFKSGDHKTRNALDVVDTASRVEESQIGEEADYA